ncbi:MAG TPA: hypothetical protein VK629_12830, partial [Steroidobacteraceae bacterium]|nr:hypothetical protein [Steroidobacteraceae bacterium]
AFLSTPSLAVECLALKAMSQEPKELLVKRDNIQRSEWLLLEFLSTDKASKKVFDSEIALSAERSKQMTQRMAALAPLASGGQAPPEQGSADCAKFEKFKSDIEKMVIDREKEIAAYHKKYGFLYSCEQISQSLYSHYKVMTSPDTSPQAKKYGAIALDAASSPFQMNAKVSGAPMQEMTKQAEAPLDISSQQRYAYFALSCLKRYQKQEKELKPPAEIQSQLKACPTTNWTQTGMCVSAAAMGKGR